MKPTGVVRRIDDLGRIVVPKEIRRNLRIRDGESLEIFVDRDVVALKKYSPMGDLEEFSKVLVDAVYQSLKSNIFITDRDDIIAVAGSLKKKYFGKQISEELERLLKERKEIIDEEKRLISITKDLSEDGYLALNTITVNGDPIGLVFILSTDHRVTDTEKQIIRIIAQFLGKHIEE